MIAEPPSKPICLPPAPMNGGKLDSAPHKVGTWVWQPKVDDWRAVVHTPSGTVWTQYGQLSTLADTGKFAVALEKLRQISTAATWLDVGMMNNRNDMMRGTIVVLDLIDTPIFQDRRQTLEILFDVLPWATQLVGKPELANDRVYLIPQYTGEGQGRALYRTAQACNVQLGRKFYEGVVAKRLGTTYRIHNQTPKTKTADWIKHRFDQ